MGDVITYVEEDAADKKAPVFRLCYRRGALLNHFDEKVSEQQVFEAILEAIDSANRSHDRSIHQTLVDFCGISMNEKCTFYHLIYIELKPGFIDEVQMENYCKEFASTVDASICRTNHIYLEYRTTAYLKPLQVRSCHNGTFAKLRDGKNTSAQSILIAGEGEGMGLLEQRRSGTTILSHIASHFSSFLLDVATSFVICILGSFSSIWKEVQFSILRNHSDDFRRKFNLEII